MIMVTRLNGTSVMLNAELIEQIESTPDTLISLTTGNKVNVLESVDEVVRRILDYRRASHPAMPRIAAADPAAPAAQGAATPEGR
jgi:flagellar protein FlbD